MSKAVTAMFGAALFGAVAMTLSGAASAACADQNTVPLKSLTAGFQAWKSLTSSMAECGQFTPELDQEFVTKLPQALAAKPALYQIAGVANDSVVGVLNAGTIRPLDALVAKYGQGLSPNQLIKLNGHIYVIGMDVNDQTLMYRGDILTQLNIPVPATWDDVLAAAEKIKQSGLVPYPLGATMKVGFNLGEDFVNMFLGFGGEFFGAGNAPAVNGPAGVKSLEMMRKLAAYMNPNYLADDSTAVQQQFQQGKIAMSNLWASRGGAMDDPKESKFVGKIESAKAPAAVPGGKPATTLWWDGAAISTNITDEQAEAAFRVIVGGMNPRLIAEHGDDVIWLVKGYQPTRLAGGAIASLQAGAPAYPVSAAMSMMHTAIGNNIGDFFTGKLTAEQALAATEAAYRTTAKEAGLLK